MLYTVIDLGDIYPDGNIPTIDGIYIESESKPDIPEQIMSTNPKDFLDKNLKYPTVS